MKLQIERNVASRLFQQCPSLSSWEEQLKLASRVEIPFQVFNLEQLNLLIDLYDQLPGGAGKKAQLQALRDASFADEPVNAGEDLEELLPELIAHLSQNVERGWLFRLEGSGTLLPWAVSRIDFTPAGSEEQARIVIDLKANSRGKLETKQLIISERDLNNQSLVELLATKGYLKETEQLLASFDAANERYINWRANFGEQFSGSGTGIYAEDPSASHRNSDWGRKPRVVLSASGGDARLVNDEEVLAERELTLQQSGNILNAMLKRIARQSSFSDEVDKRIEALAEAIPAHLFTRIPVHAYILMFHLELHHHLWVHVDNLEPYRYQPELKDKLVLPQAHTDLIDILTAEMEMLLDDIIEGKSGGTTVLCSGPAGVGKTLTAEVYAEIIGRPLYRVHSGQLGLNVAEMEKNLKDVLIRAQRWGAVMLIDEADVYIKRRDDNLTMNAVVGVFLRVLEYFNGLLFLTTNRIDDIDEAIISRCIAMVRYQHPDTEERSRIWQVMAQQFSLPLEATLLDQLAERFASASGRDIKGLAKLVAKFCSFRDCPPSMEVFEHCASFRGLDMTGTNALSPKSAA
ncbi:ATP-binding protein [Marinobacterium lutimaris]|uniref:ATP-binding protein n=1 Tax=Marinobacterium lutimaris TaxID=568106 RepID=UPI00190EF66F|nr:AAA family ATPase [Marinobacterium lutimaris]